MKRAKITNAMDYLDDDLIAGAVEEKTTLQGGIRNMTRTNIWTKVAAVAASLAILIGGGIFLTQYVGGVNANAIVALDVNPSLEIEVNGKEKVVEVNALNQDAEIVIGDMDFENVDLDITINALIGSMLQHGYLSTEQNSILISVDCSSSSKAATLQKNISEEVTALLAGQQIEASVITQTFDKDAPLNNGQGQDDGQSAAKATLINRIIEAGMTNADGVPYTHEQLASLKVHELKMMLDSKGLEVNGTQSSGNTGSGNYIGKQSALDIAFAAAEITADQAQRVEVELDFDDDTRRMLYEIEFLFNGLEYEYELDAKTGEIVKQKVEKDDGDHDDDDDLIVAPEGSITKEAALAAAYAHAQVNASDVRGVDCELEKFNGRTYYEIEFEVGNKEYEYTVDATTGEILHSEVEIDD